MDFQKYLKYKTKYLQQKNFLQKGGVDRISVKVQRVGIVKGDSADKYMFDIMLYDTEAPEELKNKSTHHSRVGYIVWAMFKNDGEPHRKYLNCEHPLIKDAERKREIEDYKQRMGEFYIKVLDRAWELTKTKYKAFMAKEDQVPLLIKQEELLDTLAIPA